MQVVDVLNLLNKWAPLTYSEEFDNTGLLVGSSHTKVKGILVCLDTLDTVVEEAVKNDCNLIVSFHPIIFSGLKSLSPKDHVTKSVTKAIKNDVAIIAVHTALDNLPGGVSGTMAKVLGLENTQVMMPKEGVMYKLITYAPSMVANQVREALFAAGAGALGLYQHCSFNSQGTGTFFPKKGAKPSVGKIGLQHEEAETQIQVSFLRHQKSAIIKSLKSVHPYQEVAYDILKLNLTCPDIGMGILGSLRKPTSIKTLLAKLKKDFNCVSIKHSKIHKQQVSKIAVLGGSGSFAIDRSKELGADVYITADLKYHDFFKGGDDFILIDIGHYESEQFTKDLIVDYLSKKITNFAPALPSMKVLKSNVKTNPISYY